MKRRVYIETTIVSYLTARPSRDLIDVARQEITREWWVERREAFDLFISQFVVDEAGDGDPDAAVRRLTTLRGLRLLEFTPDITALAKALLAEGVFPAKAVTDAFHLAVTTVHRMDVLLTWNCRHLANAELLGAAFHLVRAKGYEPPIVCTPEGLMGD